MSSSRHGQRSLPRDLLEVQLSQVELVIAMYAIDDAVTLDETATQTLASLRVWCDSDGEGRPDSIEPSIQLLLDIDISTVDAGDHRRPLQVEVSIPLVFDDIDPGDVGDMLDEPPPPRIRLRQPEWMNRAEVARLSADVAQQGEDISTILEYLKDAAGTILQDEVSRQTKSSEGQRGLAGPITRVWFYFPSISTRSKRDDLINNAPGYGLTGFLLAGKPGVLCLEGNAQLIDEYMKFIKTESWSDIPSQHKKVTEKYREEGPGVERKFGDMREITDIDAFSEKRGVRANRNDMGALETWLNEKGVGDAFKKVFI